MELPPFTWGTSKASSLNAFADAKRLAARTYEVQADTEQAQTAAAEAGQGKLTLTIMTQCLRNSAWFHWTACQYRVLASVLPTPVRLSGSEHNFIKMWLPCAGGSPSTLAL